MAGSTLPGVFSPAGVQAGTLDPHITSALVTGAATGGISASDLDWFRSRGPGELVERIRVPTLLTEGTVDTPFTLQEAIDNFSVLKRNGVPVKMMWHCGGHGVCNVPAGTVAGGAPLATRPARLRIGRVSRRRAVVRSNGIRVRNARLVVRNSRGRVVARSRLFDVVRRRKARLRWSTRARPGRYRVRVAGRDPQGRRVRAGKRVRLR